MNPTYDIMCDFYSNISINLVIYLATGDKRSTSNQVSDQSTIFYSLFFRKMFLIFFLSKEKESASL